MTISHTYHKTGTNVTFRSALRFNYPDICWKSGSLKPKAMHLKFSLFAMLTISLLEEVSRVSDTLGLTLSPENELVGDGNMAELNTGKKENTEYIVRHVSSEREVG